MVVRLHVVSGVKQRSSVPSDQDRAGHKLYSHYKLMELSPVQLFCPGLMSVSINVQSGREGTGYQL